MYNILDHGTMMSDSVRLNAYAQALHQVIKPDSVVLDMGTGTGIFALLACQFGTRRVYAIEPDDAIQVARQIAVENGYAERIEFIQDLSTRVTLPEKADVIISDLRGVLPLFQNHLPSIADARKRLLAPAGVLIPERDTLWAVVVEALDLYRDLTAPWDDNPYHLDMQAARQSVTNTWRKARVAPEQLLVEPRCWATLDYASVESPNISAEASWMVARPGTGHGLGIWFDSTLAGGVCFSNAPGEPELVYGHAFFPWSAPVPLAEGDTVSVALRADLVGEDYVWCWDTCVLDQGDPGRVKANFKQSTFFGTPVSAAGLRKRDASHVATLNEDGEIDRFILTLMDGEQPLGEIASRASDRFPSRFPKWEDALARVGRLSQKYSQ